MTAFSSLGNQQAAKHYPFAHIKTKGWVTDKRILFGEVSYQV